ncbi:MAG: TonB-dependent receptor [Steroidobacteraceae bacterium]
MENIGRVLAACASVLGPFQLGATATAAAADEQPGSPASIKSNTHQGITDTAQLNEIIVTATRRDERLQDVPGQISAISGATLDQLQARTLADFAAFTPGVSFLTSTPVSNIIVIRGITTGATQLNSAVGLYLDDVPIGSSTPFGGGALASNLGLFDLERVEVLNGPQGTLFGANALGGTLRYITAAPSLLGFTGRVETEGSYAEHADASGAVRAMVNIPLSDDRAALRLDGVLSDDSGFIDDPSHGRSNVGDARTKQLRASLLVEPTSDLTVKLSGYGQEIKSNGLGVSFRSPVTHRPISGPYDQSYANPQPSETELYLGSATVDWNLPWAKLTSVTAYQENKLQAVADYAVAYSAILGAALGPAAIQPYTIPTSIETKRVTQEVRLASADHQFIEWVAGAFYSHERTLQNIAVNNTAAPDGGLFGIPLGEFRLPSTAREYALFGDATLNLSSQFDITVGARHSWDRQVFTTAGSGLLVNPGNPLDSISSTADSDDGVTTYLFNARYRPTPSTAIYARIASGYRPGGPNVVFGGAGTGNSSFEPDSLWNYELGIKQNVFDGRGFANISLYHIDWSKIQLSVNVGGINQLVNGGDARVNGIDSSFSFRVLPDLNILASATYTDAKLTTVSPLLGLNYEGARLPLSPRFSGAIAANYTFLRNDTLTGDFNISDRYIGTRNQGYPGSAIAPLYALASYNIVDMTLSMRWQNGWEAGSYLKNVFDERGEVSANTVTSVFVPSAPVPVTLTQPRTVGITIAKSF